VIIREELSDPVMVTWVDIPLPLEVLVSIRSVGWIDWVTVSVETLVTVVVEAVAKSKIPPSIHPWGPAVLLKDIGRLEFSPDGGTWYSALNGRVPETVEACVGASRVNPLPAVTVSAGLTGRPLITANKNEPAGAGNDDDVEIVQDIHEPLPIADGTKSGETPETS
jgi:hypothetical protein